MRKTGVFPPSQSKNLADPTTGRYLELIWLGMAFLTLGFGLLISLGANYSLTKVVAFQLVAGFGVGLVFQSPLVALQTLVAPEDIATATATFGFFRNVATSLSVTVGGVVFQNAIQTQQHKLEAAVGSSIAAKFTGGSASANVESISLLPPTQRAIVRGAYATSLRDVWIMNTCTAAIGLAVSFVIGRKILNASSEKPQHARNEADIELRGMEGSKLASN